MLNQDLTTMVGINFRQEDGVELIEIDNEHAKAVITTLGACVLSFIPNGKKDLLWVSDQAVYDGSKPIRGGIPVCWPWFGKALESGLPAHGFVRNKVWQIKKVEHLDSGETRVQLTITADEHSKALWNYDFELVLNIEIGKQLLLSLNTTNCSDEPFTITEALHTYFNIGLPQGLRIEGLDGAIHEDKLVEHALPVTQQGDVVLNPPMDSVFQAVPGEILIHDMDQHRRIRIRNRNAKSAVVWNPGAEIVKGFNDIDNGAWQDFACVESGNVLDDFVTINPGSKHTLSVQYSILE